MVRYAALAALTFVCACVPPPGPRERLGFSAHEMNSATRFGRMDIAMSFVARDAKADFAQRHNKWHESVRIVDVDLTSMQMVDKETAEVHLKIAWHRVDESTLRSSELAQKWSYSSGDWQIEEEVRIGGAPGLFHYPKGKSKSKKSPLAGSVDAPTEK